MSTNSDGQTIVDHRHPRQPRRVISRRALLGYAARGIVGVAALSGAGVIGYTWPRSKAKQVIKTISLPQFHSRPDLDPMRVHITNIGPLDSSGHIFLTPSIVPAQRGVNEQLAIQSGLGQEGLMILDQTGELIWFEPLPHFATNLRVQSYAGAPVLTYWRGDITGGTGKGVGVILDTSYREIAIVNGDSVIGVDLHDFSLTASGTALITAYTQRTMDLRNFGGGKNDAVFDCFVQEIDVASGRVVFEWRSLDHIDLAETYIPYRKGMPFDYFHVNSVSLDDENNLLVSARNTWALYKINRTNGNVVWRLGGKKSDFTMGPGTNFYWQHHATRLAGTQISLFDDGATPQEEAESRALILDVDEQNKVVSLVKSFTHPAKLLAPYEGSAQVLPNGHMFVGWGAEPYFSEFDANGQMVLDGRFPTNDQSYRSFRMPWSAAPTTSPDIAVLADSVGGHTVYASWNGATGIRLWQVLAGPSASRLRPVVVVPKSHFETAITVHTKETYVSVAALDESHTELGRSKTVKFV